MPPPATQKAEADELIRVRLDEVSLTYNRQVHAVRGVSLAVPHGQHLVLTGRSGSGKSSLLACISGRTQPTGGRVERTGRMAVIHQDLRLVKQRSAIHNVLHGATARVGLVGSVCGFPVAERDRAAALLGRVGLTHRTHQRVGRLSGGEQQRVAIARALMQGPDILLADEPVAALDREHAQEIMELLAEISRDEDLTVISVLHDFELACSYGDRILGLASGRVVRDVKPQQSDCGCAATPPILHSIGVVREIDTPSPEPQRQPADEQCPKTASHQPDHEREPADPFGQPGNQRWLRGFGGVVTVAIVVLAFVGLDIEAEQLSGAPQSVSRFISNLFPASWAEFFALPWADLSMSLLETLQMSVIGTLAGVLISWPLAALAARNVGPGLIRVPMRFLLNVIRTVPSIIWGLFFVAAVGLGPLAGVLALVAYSVGYLTKFFYEGFEGVDPAPPDALREIGASGPQRFIHAVWPAAQPAVVSASLFMLEYNVRAASVLGIVGAGGIGWEMKLYYDYRSFPAMLAALLLILAVVIILDAASNWLRARLVRG